MPALVPWFLLLHVGAAIIAFGPVFAFPLIGAAGGREPQHGNFGLRITETLVDRLVLPFAASMPVTGLLMVWSAGFDFYAAHWLDLAIVVYVVAISTAVLVQRPTVQRMIALTGGGPGHPAAGLVRAEGPGAESARPAAGGPPPEFLALVRRSQRTGMFLTACITLIVFLMVVKPTF